MTNHLHLKRFLLIVTVAIFSVLLLTNEYFILCTLALHVHFLLYTA